MNEADRVPAAKSVAAEMTLTIALDNSSSMALFDIPPISSY